MSSSFVYWVGEFGRHGMRWAVVACWCGD